MKTYFFFIKIFLLEVEVSYTPRTLWAFLQRVRKIKKEKVIRSLLFPLLTAEAKFLNKNGEEVSKDNAIIKFSDDQLNQLTLIRAHLYNVNLAYITTYIVGELANGGD